MYTTWHEDKIFEAVYGASLDKPLSPELARFADNLLMIGRYLNNILGIIECNTEEEALTTLRDLVRYDGLEIEWSVTEWHTPFLDMHIYIDPTSDHIEHRPYSKPLNHKEHIQWISAHPKDDWEKSTFIGEMSRMAVLSSKPEHYTAAVLELMKLYYRCGYPSDLVKHWALEQYKQRWNNRFVEKLREPNEVLVLKSQFNPVWSAFNIKELGNCVVTAWHLEIDNMLDHHSKHMAAMSIPVSPPPARNTPGSFSSRQVRVHTKTQCVRVSTDSVQRTLGDLDQVVAARDNKDYVE